MHILSIITILVSSSWSWKIFSFNPYLLLIIWSSSVVLYLSLVKSSRKILYIFCLSLIPILIMQWKTTKNAGLDYMSITDKQLFATRRFELSTITPDLGRYLENKPVYIFNNFEQNLFRNIDLNIYFFGGHPRERSGVKEFEKFSFLFLPFFILGLFKIIKTSSLQLLISFFAPLLVLSFIGQDNQVGPFSLFPFFSVTIATGILSRKCISI